MQGDGFTVGGMAKGAAMLVAEHGHDAGRAHHRRRRPPPSSSRRRSPHGVADSFNALDVDGCTSTNDTVLLLASGARRPGRRRPPSTRPWPRPAPTSPGRWPATPRAPPRSCASGSSGRHADDEALIGARAVARSQLVQVLVVRQGPLLGPHRQRARLVPASHFDPALFRVSYGGVDGLPRAASTIAHDADGRGRPHGRSPPRHRRRPRARRRAGPRSSPTTSPTPTSTRTWARRERQPTGARSRRASAPMAPAAADVNTTEVLIEALPYIRRFFGTTVVVKYGGNAMADPALADRFAADIVLLHSVGIRAGRGARRRPPDRRPAWRGSARSPSSATASGSPTPRPSTSPAWCWSARSTATSSSAINAHGPLAVGLSGEDAGLIEADAARPRPRASSATSTSVNPAHHRARCSPRTSSRSSPPSAPTSTGQAYNINADTVAGAIAAALGAEKLIYLTDVAGPARATSTTPTVAHHRDSTPPSCAELIADGVAHRRHDPQDRGLPRRRRRRRRLGPPARRPRPPRACCSSCSPTPASAP